MKILITGGAGYIGSVATEGCLSAGHAVVVFDNLSQGHRKAVHPDAVLIEADLADSAALDATFATHSFDAVMHFASRTLVGESMQQPFAYLGENVTHGLNLLQTTVRHGVKRFILSSTANLFGKPEKIPISEKEQIVPGSPYGESKYILERMLAWLDRTQGLRYASLRYFNAAGATAEHGENHSPETHLIPLVLEVALGQREKITVFGDDYPTPDGSCVRDYIHVADLAQAHLLALESLDQKSQLYNLGNGQGFSVLEVIEAARNLTGHPIPIEIGARRPGDPPTLVASSEKIRTELGWAPRFPDVQEIIETAWNWHRQHPAGYHS